MEGWVCVHFAGNFNTFSRELSGGRLVGINGWGLIGVDALVDGDTSTT